MALDLYKKIMADKGTNKKDTVNNPLAYYLVENDDSEVSFLSTNVITMNILMGGKFDGGIAKGRMTMLSSPSKYGKTFIALSVIKTAQKDGMSVVVIDTERRFPFAGAKHFGINIAPEKLMVFQENSIEEVKNIVLKILDGIDKEERKNILFVIDSWGTLVSSKSIEDGLAGKDVKDMTLTQKKNELANILLNTKSTYLVVNHVYTNIGGFGDPLSIPGGFRLYFNCSSVILCMSRAREKDAEKNVKGYVITAKAHKGDFCKEDSVLEFRIKADGGLDVFYGLLPDALAGGYLDQTKDGKSIAYTRTHIKNDKPVKEEDIYTTDFWLPIFKQTDFKDYLKKTYQYQGNFDIVKDEAKLETIGTSDVVTDTTTVAQVEEATGKKKGKKS